MKRRDGYLGGSTVIRLGSSWFAGTDEETERVHAQGLREGEMARDQMAQKELARKKKMLKENAKQLKYLKKKKKSSEQKKAALIESGRASARPEPGSNAEKYLLKQEQKMAQVKVDRKKTRKFTDT